MAQCWLYDRCNHKDCEKDFCLRKYKLDCLYRNALMTENQKKHITLTVDADMTDYEEFKQLVAIEKDIKSFVAQGKNLFLFSKNCGNGKTSMATRMIESYFEAIWAKADIGCHALFIHVPTFFTQLKSQLYEPTEQMDYILSNILQADLVVWDEIVTEKNGTEFEVNQLLGFISSRLTAGKSNIYTANRTPAELTENLGARLASRICYSSINVELHGADKRMLGVGGMN